MESPRSWQIANPLGCPIVKTLNIIGGKWKPMILHMLSSRLFRFNELRRHLPLISHKILTQQLRELESDGIISREVFAEIPPRVQYQLTPLGKSLIPVLDELYRWGSDRK